MKERRTYLKHVAMIGSSVWIVFREVRQMLLIGHTTPLTET